MVNYEAEMTAQIKLKKLTGINSGDKKVVTTVANVQKETSISAIGTDKLVFAGQDYKGTLDNSGTGTLTLELERPENHFTITGVKVKTSGSTHTLENNGKDATVEIVVTSPAITEKDSGWFTTQLDLKGLTATGSSLKFGEWNDYDLPDKCYVDISFA